VKQSKSLKELQSRLYIVHTTLSGEQNIPVRTNMISKKTSIRRWHRDLEASMWDKEYSRLIQWQLWHTFQNFGVGCADLTLCMIVNSSQITASENILHIRYDACNIRHDNNIR
jgi:hypothetical protein